MTRARVALDLAAVVAVALSLGNPALAAPACTLTSKKEALFDAESGKHRVALSQLDSNGVLEIPEIEDYYNAIARRLLVAWPVAVSGVRVYVIDAPKEVAYTDPNGAVYVSWRVIDWLDSDDEVAAIVAHELSHVLMRHSVSTARSKWFSRASNLGMTAAAVAGGNVVAFAAADLANYSTVAPYWNRNEEVEADRVGMHLMAAAGFKPYAMRELIEKIQTMAPEPAKVITSEQINEKQKRYQIKPENLVANVKNKLGMTHPISEVRLEKIGTVWEQCHGNTSIRPYSRALLDPLRESLKKSARLKEIRLASQAYESLLASDDEQALALIAQIPGPATQWQVPTRVLASWVLGPTGQTAALHQIAESLLFAPDAPIIFLSGPLMYSDQKRDVPLAYALSRKIRESYNFSALFYPLLLRSYKRQQSVLVAENRISESNKLEFEITAMMGDCMSLHLLTGQCEARD